MNPHPQVRASRTRTRRVPRSSVLRRVRGLCLALPETSERMSHGQPTFFIGGKTTFVMYMDNHHNDGRLALWCAATSEIQQMLIRSSPECYFMPPYVGYRGWVGVRLDRNLPWSEIAVLIEDAFLTVAPPQVIQGARRRGG